MLDVRQFKNGWLIIGDATDQNVVDFVKDKKAQLIVTDPPYGNVLNVDWDKTSQTQDQFATWMIEWTKQWAECLENNCAFYVWGGIGNVGFRPFFNYLSRIESESELKIANLITWKKKRAYGIQHNYLFTREECVYLFKGNDVKKPRVFNVPYLNELRGYDGYNKKYPAKSQYKRRSNVWADVTEIMKGKVHDAEKPVKLYELIIEAHTHKDEIVVDMFAGSGACGIACINTGRRFVLVESDIEIAEKISERIIKHEQ